MRTAHASEDVRTAATDQNLQRPGDEPLVDDMSVDDFLRLFHDYATQGASDVETLMDHLDRDIDVQESDLCNISEAMEMFLSMTRGPGLCPTRTF